MKTILLLIILFLTANFTTAQRRDESKDFNRAADLAVEINKNYPIKFSPATEIISSAGKENLSRIFEEFKKFPNGTVIEIGAHVAEAADSRANLELSAKRAAAVKTALVNLGVNPKALTTEGYGDKRPLFALDNAQERQKNNRIEFLITLRSFKENFAVVLSGGKEEKSRSDEIEEYLKMAEDNGISREQIRKNIADFLKENNELGQTAKKPPQIPAEAVKFYEEAKSYEAKEEFDKAFESYNKALQIYPRYAAALIGRARGYENRENYKSALDDANNAIALAPNEIEAFRVRGGIYRNWAETIEDNSVEDYLQAKNYRLKSVEDLNKVIQVAPPQKITNSIWDYNPYLNRCSLLYKLKNYAAAIKDCEKSVSINSDEVSAEYYLIGMSKLNLKQGGLGELQKSNESFTSEDTHLGIARYYEERGLMQEAEKSYNSAVETSLSLNGDPNLLAARGGFYVRTEKDEQALADLTEAIKLDPKNAMAHYQLAMLYKANPDLAAANAKNADDLEPDEIWLEELELALKYKPTFADAYLARAEENLAWMMASLKDSWLADPKDAKQADRILSDYQTVLKLDPDSAKAYRGRAEVYARTGKRDAALADYTQAIRLDPQFDAAYLGRMLIYCKMGKKDLSVADQKKVKELNPKLPVINPCQ